MRCIAAVQAHSESIANWGPGSAAVRAQSSSAHETVTRPRPLGTMLTQAATMALLLQVLQAIPPKQAGDDPGPGHAGTVLCVAAHPTLPLMASAGHEPDCTVKLWSAEPSS